MLLNQMMVGAKNALRSSTDFGDRGNKNEGDPFDDLGLDPNYDFKRLFRFANEGMRPWFPSEFEYSRGVGRKRGFAERLHLFLTDPQSSKLGERTIEFIFLVIGVSCVCFILETLPVFQLYSDNCKVCEPLSGDDRQNDTLVDIRASFEAHCVDCEPSSPAVFSIIEAVCVSIFAFDYLTRVLTAHAIPCAKELSISPTYVFPTWRGLRRTFWFAVDWLNIVDLVAIVPFFIDVAVKQTGVSLSVVRVLRLLRIARMFQFGQFSSGMLLFFQVIRTSLMAFFIIIVFTMFGMVVFGSLIFYAERGSWDPATGTYNRAALYYLDPDEPSPFTSIPTSFWWVLVTFTTVGYGDMYPTTHIGRVIGVLCMYVGVLFIAMPITVVGANFADAYLDQQRKYEQQRRKNRAKAKVLHNLLFMRRLEAFRKGWNAWTAHAREMERQEHDITFLVRQVVEEIVGREMGTLRSQTMQQLDTLAAKFEGTPA